MQHILLIEGDDTMPFIAIKGTFHVTGYSPDGDSIKFQADNKEQWRLLKGRTVKQNAREHVQLRLEGIDTLETHYMEFHQPLEYAYAATDFLLKELKIENVIWDNEHKKVTNSNDGTKGFVLARKTDDYRRPISFVFSDDVNFIDGEEVFLSSELVKKSLNYKLVTQGLAFCTFYTGLFADIRDDLTKAIKNARLENKGFLPHDKTEIGVKVTGIRVLLEEIIILPKLFRRIVSYLENGGSIDGLIDSLKSKPEPIFILSQKHFTHFHNIVSVQDKVVKLLVPPEDIVFLDKTIFDQI